MCLKCLGKSAILVVYQGKIQPNFVLVILSSFRVVVGVLRGRSLKGKRKGERITSFLTAVHLTPFTTAASAPQSITGVLFSTTYSAFN